MRFMRPKEQNGALFKNKSESKNSFILGLRTRSKTVFTGLYAIL